MIKEMMQRWEITGRDVLFFFFGCLYFSVIPGGTLLCLFFSLFLRFTANT